MCVAWLHAGVDCACGADVSCAGVHIGNVCQWHVDVGAVFMMHAM